MPQVQNNNGFPRAQQQSYFVARHGQTAVSTIEGESKFGGSYGQQSNSNSEGPPRFGAQMDPNVGSYRYNRGYKTSYGLQGFDAPHGESDSAASKDHTEATPSVERHQVAF